MQRDGGAMRDLLEFCLGCLLIAVPFAVILALVFAAIGWHGVGVVCFACLMAASIVKGVDLVTR